MSVKDTLKSYTRENHWGTEKQNKHTKINGQLVELWNGSEVAPTALISSSTLAQISNRLGLPKFKRLFIAVLLSSTTTVAANPGGVTPEFWVKADAGVTASGTDAITWADQSATAYDMTDIGSSAYQYVLDAINGYPVMRNDDGGVRRFYNTNPISLQTFSILVTPNSPTGCDGIIGEVGTDNFNIRSCGDSEWSVFGNVADFSQGGGKAWQNGKEFSANFSMSGGPEILTVQSASPSAYDGGLEIGESGHSRYFPGDVAEIIGHDGVLSDEERIKTESYLAFKYGVTLDSTTHPDYVLSTGDVAWSNQGHDYNQRIVALVNDTGSLLTNTVSVSTENDAMIIVSTDTDFTSSNTDNTRPNLDENGALVIGSNAGDAGFTNGISNRSWRVQSTGSPKEVYLAVADTSSAVGLRYKRYSIVSENVASRTYSSTYTSGHTESLLTSRSAWVPAADDESPWIEVPIAEGHEVVGVVTAPRAAVRRQRIETYSVQAKLNDGSYVDIEDGKVFQGITATGPEFVSNYFETPDNAVAIRLLGKSWQSGQEPAARMGLIVKGAAQIAGASRDGSALSSVLNDDPANETADIDGTGAWTPSTENAGEEWLQIAVNSNEKVSAIITQGNPDNSNYVSSYLAYAVYNNGSMQQLNQGNAITANSDATGTVRVSVDVPYGAKAVRIEPQTWVGGLSMRAGLAVSAPNTTLYNPADTEREINDAYGDSVLGEGHALTELHGTNGWSPADEQGNVHWIKLPIPAGNKVLGVSTQGRKTTTQWVTEYKVEAELADGSYAVISESEQGNSDQHTVVTNLINVPSDAVAIKVTPLDYYGYPSMRIGLALDAEVNLPLEAGQADGLKVAKLSSIQDLVPELDVGGEFELIEDMTDASTTYNNTPHSTVLSISSHQENNATDVAIGTFSATEVDGDALGYSLIAGAGDDDNAAFSISGDKLFVSNSFDYEAKSSYSLRVRVDDGKNGVFDSIHTISITDENDAPTIDGAATTSIDEGQAYSFTPTAADADGDDISFAITNKPSWASFDSATGALTGTPTYTDVGTYSDVSISVTDSAKTTALTPFTIVVNDIAPTAPTSGTNANADGTLTVAGTGEPGSEVEVTFPDGTKGTATVGTDGTYAVTSSTPQSSGDVSVTQKDTGGNTSTATTEGYTDTSAPAAPTSATTANEDGTLTVAGTGEPGSEVEVTFPDGTKGTATVGTDGTYSVTSEAPQGSGDVSVAQTDADGNTSTATAEGFTDTSAPAAPTSATTANTDGTLTVAGTGEPGSEVEVTFPDGTKGTATVGTDGTYSVTSEAPQGSGDVSVAQTDADGNTSTATAEGFTDTSAPAAPTSATTANADGTLTVAGTGEPGSEVEVTFPDGTKGTATVGTDGTYSVTSEAPQGSGDVSVAQTDADGNTSTATAEGFTDTSAPAAPTSATTANADGTLTVAGTGEPGSEVEVTFPDGTKGTATVGTDGTYSVTSEAPQGSGDVSVAQTDADGNTSTATAEGFTDTSAPAAPTSGTTANEDGTLTVAGTGEPGSEVEVTFPDGTKGTATVGTDGTYSVTSEAPQGSGDVSVAQTDADGNTSTATAEGYTDTSAPAAPTSVTTANTDGTLTVAGTGEPGSEVSVTFPDGTTGTATVDAEGNYSVTSAAPQGSGDVSVAQTDADGNTSTATAQGFTDTSAPAAPTSATTANTDGTLTVAGTGEPGSEVEVTFPDGTKGTATVGTDGTYSVTSEAPQGSGDVSVAQTDADGNTSTATAEGFTDTSAPAAPTSATTANTDGTLTVAGTGEPGSEVEVTFPDGTKGTATVGTDGTYSVTSEAPQGSGDVSVAQTDADGNTSTATAEGFTDTSAPAAPTSATTANADGTLTVAGTGEPGSEVEVTFPDGTKGTATVGTDGTYSVTSEAPQGSGDVSVAQTDADGNTSTATAEGFTDTSAPAAPTSGTTANEDGTLTVAGTGEPGSEVEVTFPDGTKGTATVGTDGTYSVTSEAPQGSGDVSVAQTDADGNTSTATAEGFTDTSAPAAPTSGTTANEDGTLTVAGTGEPGSEVEVTFPDGTKGTATVGTDGTYSVTSEAPQGSGDVSVAQTDADGNTSTATTEGFTDTTPPTAPTSGTTANEDGTLTVAGTGEPGSEVSVSFPDGTTGTATVDAEGNYSVTSATPQGSGDVSVAQTDADGNTSTATAEGFTDTSAPAAPTSATTANTDGTLTVAGTGEPGSEVSVTFPDGTTGTATVGTDGTYAVTSEAPQGSGDVSVAQTDADGNTSTATAEGFTDTSAPAAPTSVTTVNADGTLTVAGTGEPGSEVSVTFPDGTTGTATVDAEGNYSVTSAAPQGSGDVSVAQTDADGNTSTATAEGFTDTTPPTAPTSGTTANEDGTLTVAGTGEPGSEVSVTFPDGTTGTATVDAEGNYSVTSAAPQGSGDVSVAQTDADGNTSTATAEGFTDTTPPAAPTSGTTANEDGTLTVAGTGEPGSEVSVSFPDGTTGTATVGTDGTYSVTSEAPQGSGDVSVAQTDADGNTSTATAEGFTDTSAPAAPTSGTTANEDGTLTVAGTGEPGSEVSVTFPDGTTGTATVGPDGTYAVTSEAPQGSGDVSVAQTDADGNTSTATAEGFTDTTPPAAPTSGTTANEDGTLTVAGTGEPGSEVSVSFPDGTTGTATVDAEGNYSVTSAAPQGSGDVSVAQTDADGNTSTDTAEGFTDTTPPAAPTSGTTANEDGTLTVAGTGEPGSEVSVTFPDGTTGTATVDAEGNYSITSSAPQGTGDVSITQTDKDGNTSTATAEGFTDTTPPAAPTSGTTANEDGTLTVAGTGEPGSEVSVTFPDGTTGTATVAPDGTYAVTSEAPQGSGDVSVAQTDADGNTSTATAEGFTDTTPPTAPTSGTTANEDGTLTVAGTGEPGSEVSVTFPDGTTGTATVDAEGNYSITSSAPQGTGDVSITQTDKDGNTSTATAEGFTDTTPPAAPTTGTTANEDGTLTVAGTGEPGSLVAVTFPDGTVGNVTVGPDGTYAVTSEGPQGSGSVAVAQTDKDGNTSTATAEGFTDTTPPAAPTTGTTANEDGTLTVAGTGEPGSEVSVTFPDGTVGNVTVGPDGTYAVTSEAPQGSGSVSVAQTDKDGNTSTAEAEGFTDNTPPESATSASTTDENGNTVVSGTGEPGAEVAVTFPDGSVGKAIVDAEGNYSITSATPQGSGSISVAQTDKDGNTSTATSGGFTFEPPAPAVDGTSLSGIAPPGSPVTITSPSGEVCQTVADANGNYSCEFDSPVDPASVSIKPGVAPVAPVPDLSAPLVLKGTAEPGAPVTVVIERNAVASSAKQTASYSDGRVKVAAAKRYTVCHTIADSNGDYECQLIEAVTAQDSVSIFSGLTPAATTLNGKEVTGKANPLSSVTVTDTLTGDSCDALVDINGNYSCELSNAPSSLADLKVDTMIVSEAQNREDQSNVTVKAAGQAPVTIEAANGSVCATVANADGDFSCDIDMSGMQGKTMDVTFGEPVSQPEPQSGGVFTGRGEPGAPITLTTASGQSCSTIVAADGSYSCDFGSEVSASITVDVGIAPSASVSSDGGVKGVAEPGATITLTDPATGASCSAVADAQGVYDCKMSPAPASGADLKIDTAYDASSKFFSELPSEPADVETNVSGGGGGSFGGLLGLLGLLLLGRRFRRS